MTQGNDSEAQLPSESELSFGPFRLEAAQQLWRGDQRIGLRRQSLTLLRYLAERPGQLVTKEELLTQLWPGIYVSPTVVKVCVREIRSFLGDDAKQSHFIETLGAQGYRFVAPLVTTSLVLRSQFLAPSSKSQDEDRPLTIHNWQLATPFVGREHELVQLQAQYARALRSEQQIIFVSGEAGIGKTSLVERFLAQASAGGAVRIGRGNCIEQAGQGEAYLPVLQALQQLCGAPDGDQVVAILRRYAPLWLLQLSGEIEADERESLQRQVQGSSPQRMLRELAHAIKKLADESPLILFFDDLQWSDASTVDFLAYLAQLREPIRLLVVGTYRPADAILSQSPLRRVVQMLNGRKQSQGLALELLTQAEIEAYLTQRLVGGSVVDVLGPVIYRCTEGNALFVMHFVDYLLQQDLLVEADNHWQLRVEPATLEELIPDHVQALITKQIERLSREVQQLLEVASVMGLTFTAGEVVAVVNRPLEATEAVYDELATQGQFIETQGLAEWPDRSLTVRYHFRHALYQQVLYHRIGLAQRVRWHRQIGEHFAKVYGEHTQEVAGELAFHFERGREYRRAILFRQEAGEHALQQNAYQKALEHGQAGITMLTQLPATTDRGQVELRLHQLVSIALEASRGFTDNEVEDHLRRAQHLCQELENNTALVSVIVSLARRQLYRANRPELEELVRQEKELVERLHDPVLLVQLHTQLVASGTVQGCHTQAEEHYQHVVRHYNPQAHRSSPAFLGQDPFAGVLGPSGLSRGLAGWLDQGWSRLAQGLARAEELEHYVVLANGLLLAVPVKALRGEFEEASQLAEKMGALSREHDFSLYALLADLLQGGLAVQGGALEEGIAAITGGLSQYRAIGAQFFIPYFLSLLAEGYQHQRKVAKALQVVDEALNLTATNSDVFWEAELYRQKGELMLAQSSVQRLASNVEANQKSKIKSQKSKITDPQSLTPDPQGEAEACFQQAIAIARQQGAKLLELRATMSLAHLWQQQGKQHAARNTLSEIYNWFTEGLDTKDLQAAKVLLAELT